MWILLTRSKANWVKFIIDQIIIFKANVYHLLFYTLLIQTILELYNITSSEYELLEAPKLFDNHAISQMHYYQDDKNVYYY